MTYKWDVMCSTLPYFILLYFSLYFALIYFALKQFDLLYFALLYFTLLYFTSCKFTLLYYTWISVWEQIAVVGVLATISKQLENSADRQKAYFKANAGTYGTVRYSVRLDCLVLYCIVLYCIVLYCAPLFFLYF